MKPCSAIKSDLIAAESRAPRVDCLGDSLEKISRVVDFRVFACEAYRVAHLVVLVKGNCPPFPATAIGFYRPRCGLVDAAFSERARE